MIGIGFLTSWLALSLTPMELSPAKVPEAQLPASLFASRLSLCHENKTQAQGCAAAFKYLEEIAHPAELPSSKLGAQDFPYLLKQLRAAGISENEWVTGAFNAWLTALDPHAKLMSAEDADRRASAEKILVQGAGAKLRINRGKVFVGYSMEGSAAESIGLLPGDRILSLNGKQLGSLNETGKRRWLNETVSPYHLSIERDGRAMPLVIAEKRYYLANVEAKIHEAANGLLEGILRIRSFDKDNTCGELRLAIAAVKREHVQQLRLDLNDNPGGLVREAQCVAGLFLGNGKVFARLRKFANAAATQLIPATLADGSGGGDKEILLLTEKNSVTALPLIVEINQNSASAAEMLAAALQDHHRAKVQGTRSFGKGSMQSVFHPWSNERLYLTRTTHRIFRPSGGPLQFNGVSPDLVSRSAEGENFPRERELTL